MKHKPYELTVKFLQDHKKADELFYDDKTRLPMFAVYYNPDWTFKIEGKKLLQKLREMLREEEND